ncbi:DUF721 domain-containing protein [Sorangium sp. So ce426]|uniref:DUF721 domain-containing protein n=1 Tax=unclassified Sorangium TaxID=2621164 RepID=UPI003F5C531A
MPFREWEAAVGSRIAARARPLKLERGVLHVRAASSMWAQELSLLGDTITAQLRSRGLPVQSLRFRVGKVDPVARPPWREEVRPTPKEAPLPAEVRRELGKVADTELREAIAKAAARNLGWQEAEASARPRNAPPPLQPSAAPAPGVPPPASRAAPPPVPHGAARTAPPPAPRVSRVSRVSPEAAAPATPGGDAEATSPRRGARDPRSAASRTARSDRTTEPSGAGRRGRS